MKKGFTLIELLVVVALIAIVSSLAVSKIGNLKKTASRKVSIANQQAVARAIDEYMTVNTGRLPNRFDALVDMDTPLGNGGGFDFNTVTREDVEGYFYWGPDDAAGNEAIKDRNAGLTPNLRAVLVPYSLNKAEATGLYSFGLKYLMRHTTSAQQSPAEKYGERGEDGTYLPDDAAVGLDPQSSACVAQMVTNGMVVAAITPKTNEGRQIYRDCGIELMRTEKDDGNYSESAVVAEVRALGGPLLAFGLGQECSLVGSGDGGIEVAPYADYPLRKFYRQYIALFQMRNVNNRVEAVFAGVLDPCGMTIRKARTVLE
ncbi:MAG: type II secretion system protein [Kiritimatiellae bacterium]|nr:type II secretion system protein [Kiritimatiellia bacterium]